MVKKIMTKALAPVVLKAAEKSTDYNSLCWFNQPKVPKKLMNTVK